MWVQISSKSGPLTACGKRLAPAGPTPGQRAVRLPPSRPRDCQAETVAQPGSAWAAVPATDSEFKPEFPLPAW